MGAGGGSGVVRRKKEPTAVKPQECSCLVKRRVRGCLSSPSSLCVLLCNPSQCDLHSTAPSFEARNAAPKTPTQQLSYGADLNVLRVGFQKTALPSPNGRQLAPHMPPTSQFPLPPVLHFP